MAAQQVELKLEDLWQVAQIVRFLNGQDASKLAQGSALKGILPVLHAGSIDAGGVFQAGQIGLGAKPVADLDLTTSQQYGAMLDFPRNLNVRAATYLDWVPNGRLLFEDRFANAISWVQAVGTAAYSAVRPYPGNPNCMRLTTGAGAGNQAQATLGLLRLADAQSRGLGGGLPGDGPKIWYAVLFKNTDANLGFIELGVNLYDGVAQMVARARLLYPSGQVQLYNPAAGYDNWGAPVALGTGERWHWFGVELHYQSGQNTLAYTRVRVDDSTVNLNPYAPANNAGASAVSETLLEITVQNNAAIAEVCDIGYVQLKDLTNVRNLLG